MPNEMYFARDAIILIVDDTQEDLRMLTTMLSEHNYDVRAARNGASALRAARLEKPDLILLDVDMPGADGFQVFTDLRKESTLTDIPVIFMTAKSGTQDKIRGLISANVDYVMQPIQPGELFTRINMHLALRYLNTNLHKEMHVKARILQRTNQDLMRPVNTILEVTRPVSQKGQTEDLSPATLASFCIVQKAAEQILEMANQFQRYHAMEKCAPDIDMNPYRMNELIKHLILQHQTEAEIKGVTLQFDRAETVPSLSGDPLHIEQSLSQYLRNAIQYSSRGSTIHISAYIKDDWVRVEVQDHGPGVPVEERSQLFDEFAKMSNQTPDSQPSIGLGLWLAKTLINAHNGRVGADFPDEGGSIFWLELPITIEYR